MRLTSSGGPLNLLYSGDSFFRIVLSADIGCMILGCVLLLTGTLSLLTLLCHDRRWVRISYVLMACGIVGMLTLTCVVSSMIVAYDDRAEVREFIERAWERSVKEDGETVCDIEKKFECRGFDDGECEECDGIANRRRTVMVVQVNDDGESESERQQTEEEEEEEDGCQGRSSSGGRRKCVLCDAVKEMDVDRMKKRDGCYDAIVRHFRKLFLPWAVCSAVLGAVVVMDILVTWCT